MRTTRVTPSSEASRIGSPTERAGGVGEQGAEASLVVQPVEVLRGQHLGQDGRMRQRAPALEPLLIAAGFTNVYTGRAGA